MAFVYTPYRISITRSLAPGHPTPDWELPKIADIPAPGQLFSPGDPVCTVFGHAPSETDCLAQLAERVAQILDTLTRL